MSDALYIKGPAVLVRNSDGFTISTNDSIRIDQTAKQGMVGSQFGGAIQQFVTGVEHSISFTPHGVLDASRLAAFFPFVAANVGATVFSDQSWTIYSIDGTSRTYYNAAIVQQPTVEMGIDKPSVWGPLVLKALHCKSGGNEGSLFADSFAASFPGYSFIALSSLFRGKPKLSWFKDRTTGQVAAYSTLTSDATNVTDGDVVTVGGVVYRFKNTMAAINDVKIAGSAALTLAGFKKAINGTGIAGTDYFAGTVANPNVSASTITSTTLLVTAVLPGTVGNAIVSTTTSTHLSWTAGTFANGVDARAAANAVGYSAGGPADKGWYQLITATGVKLTPKQTLQLEPNSQYGGYGNYTLTEGGCDIDFQPIDLTEYALGQATPQTVGVSLNKGDAQIVCVSNDAAPVTLTAVVTQCVFDGGSKEYHAANKRIPPLKLISTQAFDSGKSLAQLTLALS